MKKVVIIVAWLLGLLAIGWTCSARQDARQADLRPSTPADRGAV